MPPAVCRLSGERFLVPADWVEHDPPPPTGCTRLFDDTYATTFSANVVAVDGGDVVLDQTRFYPTGGGSPRCWRNRRTNRLAAVSDVQAAMPSTTNCLMTTTPGR